MIDKTDAIPLRITPYSRSSHIVTWLTPGEGKLATIIKGAQRPKSMFLGQYDLFYNCELLYYIKESNGLHIARECSPLKTRSFLRSDWRAAACASYIADIMQKVSFRGGHQQELFDLTDLVLDSLTETTVAPQIMFWFELQLANLLGLAPQLTNCVSCRKSLQSGQESAISISQGGIICSHCRSIQPENAATTLHLKPDVAALLRSWQSQGSIRRLQNIRCTANQLLALRDILGKFMAFHLEINTQCRQAAFEIMTYGN